MGPKIAKENLSGRQFRSGNRAAIRVDLCPSVAHNEFFRILLDGKWGCRD
jgi:hypothetical protein